MTPLMFTVALFPPTYTERVTHPRSGPEEAGEGRGPVPVVRRAGVRRGAAAGPAADLQVLPPVNRMVAVVRLSQRLDEINLLLCSHKAAADAGDEKTTTTVVSELERRTFRQLAPLQSEKHQNLMQHITKTASAGGDVN